MKKYLAIPIIFIFLVSIAPLLEARKMKQEHISTEIIQELQIVVYEAEDCSSCHRFKKDVTDAWQSEIALTETYDFNDSSIQLNEAIVVTPTIVMTKNQQEIARYTGYDGDKKRFWEWERKIAFESGTEYPFTGSLLDNKEPGYYVDPLTGAKLFRSDTKFDSGTGWPSFFDPIPGALSFHDDGMRVEVLSASSGIHLGHVFNDGPPPTGKRYCINSAVLKFVPDSQ
ncbi:MAG: peptide-methionine (R)-S-oxide reductase [Betaproteobacteria bacterium]|nr:peptide-methionine (R)-S-oxide reductase [Betaproteobacteria bacterium]